MDIFKKFIWEPITSTFKKHPVVAAFSGGVIGGALATIIMFHKNLGPLSEWVTGFLTLAAICVTMWIQYDSTKVKLRFIGHRSTTLSNMNNYFVGEKNELVDAKGNKVKSIVGSHFVKVLNNTNIDVLITSTEVYFPELKHAYFLEMIANIYLKSNAVTEIEIPWNFLENVNIQEGTYEGYLQFTDFKGDMHKSKVGINFIKKGGDGM